MERFKPTTLISLNCHAAAFCQAVCHQLERDFTKQQSLVQAQTLVYDRQQLYLSANLATVADILEEYPQNLATKHRELAVI